MADVLPSAEKRPTSKNEAENNDLRAHSLAVPLHHPLLRKMGLGFEGDNNAGPRGETLDLTPNQLPLQANTGITGT